MKALKLFLTLNSQVLKFVLFGNAFLKINIYTLSLLLKFFLLEGLCFFFLLKFFYTEKKLHHIAVLETTKPQFLPP